jgi:hypothetical protein
MAIAATDDLRRIIFATDRTTRKYANISRNSRVALLIDNRSPSNSGAQFAVTAIGKAQEPGVAEKESLRAAFLLKHPHLRKFLSNPQCALFQCSVEEYVVVKNFQDVAIYKPE